jgi:hypothetical protein
VNCDEKIGRQALAADLNLIKSDGDYDWLGPGVYFWEGDPVSAREGRPIYTKSGLYERTHTQIAVRSLECIKGIFIPRF